MLAVVRLTLINEIMSKRVGLYTEAIKRHRPMACVDFANFTMSIQIPDGDKLTD
jgi:hypothetical protein